MKLLEYEGKRLFAAEGIPVPTGEVVRIGDGVPRSDIPRAELESAVVAAGRAAAALAEPNGDGVVVKAQLDMGGRGKAGLIRAASSIAAASEAARAILSAGFPVGALLIEQAVDIARELYVSISVDPAAAGYLLLASAEGGVDIEELARTRPEAVARVAIDPAGGLARWQARGLAYDLGLAGGAVREWVDIVDRLYRVFVARDAELVEINPLFVTADGALVAGDAKVMIDDNSLDRQPDFPLERRRFDSDTAFEAARDGIPYVQFDGAISLMCAGAGLTTTVFDLVHMAGGTIANYLEFGGPNYRKARRAMELCLANRSAVILIVTFGTIARADVMAEGVVEAIRALRPDRPIVTCIRGTNEEAAHATLRAAGLEPLTDTEDAVAHAVAIAGGAS